MLEIALEYQWSPRESLAAVLICWIFKWCYSSFLRRKFVVAMSNSAFCLLFFMFFPATCLMWLRRSRCEVGQISDCGEGYSSIVYVDSLTDNFDSEYKKCLEGSSCLEMCLSEF